MAAEKRASAAELMAKVRVETVRLVSLAVPLKSLGWFALIMHDVRCVRFGRRK
jgi:hypothetical protein